MIPSMASVEGVVCEINETCTTIKNRTDNVGLQRGRVNSLYGKIKTVKAFGTSQATQLYDAIEGFEPEVFFASCVTL